MSETNMHVCLPLVSLTAPARGNMSMPKINSSLYLELKSKGRL